MSRAEEAQRILREAELLVSAAEVDAAYDSLAQRGFAWLVSRVAVLLRLWLPLGVMTSANW